MVPSRKIIDKWIKLKVFKAQVEKKNNKIK
jgi:hypothetical protein